MFRRTSLFGMAFVLAATLAFGSRSASASYLWDQWDGVGGNWAASTNPPWGLAQPPTASQGVLMNSGDVTIATGTNAVAESLLNSWAGALGATPTTINVTGGSLTVQGQAGGVQLGFVISEWLSGTVNQSGGNVTADKLVFNHPNYAEVGATSTYNLNGGMLNAGAISASGQRVAVLGLNGGTLQAGATTTAWVGSGITANVQAGGAIIDVQGFDVGVLSALVNGVSGVDGGLTVKGTSAGILELLAAGNAYTGATTIDGGTLKITSAFLNDASSVKIASGAQMQLAFTGEDEVGALYLDGIVQAAGTWGHSGSGAANVNDIYFASGAGVLNVVPEPSALVLLATGLIGLIAYAWRKRK